MSGAHEFEPSGVHEKHPGPPGQGKHPNISQPNLLGADKGRDIDDDASVTSDNSGLFFSSAGKYLEEDGRQPSADRRGNLNNTARPEPESEEEEEDLEEGEGQGHLNNPQYQQYDESDNDDFAIINPNEIPDQVKARFDAFQFRPLPAPGVICTSYRSVKVEEDGDELWNFPEYPARDNSPEFDGDEYASLSDGEESRDRGRQKQRLPRRIRQTSAQEGPQDIVEDATHDTHRRVHQGTSGDPFRDPRSQSYPPIHPEIPGQDQTLLAQTPNENNRDECELAGLFLTVKNLKDDLEIAVITQRKLKRSKDAGLLDGSGLARLEQLDAEIHQMQSEISEIEKNMKEKEETRRRQAPAADAREYWRRKYGKNPQFARRLNKFRNLKRPGDPSNTSGRDKRRKQNAMAVNSVTDQDPMQALADMGDVPIPGPMTANTKTALTAQLRSFSKISGEDIKDDSAALNQATASFGYKKCTMDKQLITGGAKWKLKGLKTSLYNHQVVGASWMVSRELSPHGPYGGIQADSMGLGKTLQILACMVANPPTAEDVAAGRVTTLLVLPAGSVYQWKREIARHTDFPVPYVYKGCQSENIPIDMWSRWQIVIATYHQVAAAFPSKAALEKIRGKKLDNEELRAEFNKELGDLFRVEFYRVVLDEAHAIKGNKTQASIACCRLSSKYRWAVTGTPIHNGIDEMYPYFRFTGVEFAGDLTNFKKWFGNIELDNNKGRLQAIVRNIMIRSTRKQTDKFAGRPILEIPSSYPREDCWIKLSAEEEALYRHQESVFRDQLNVHLADGSADTMYLSFFAFLTCLRQLTAHPFLAERLFHGYWTAEDFGAIRKRLTKHRGHMTLIQQLQACHKRRDINGPGQRNRRDIFFSVDTMRMDRFNPRNGAGSVLCGICGELPVDPQISDCGHAFCEACFLLEQEHAREESDTDVIPCPTCGTKIRSARPFDLLFVQDCVSQTGNEASVNARPRNEARGSRRLRAKNPSKEKIRGYGDDLNKLQPKPEYHSTLLEHCDKNGNLAPSAKLEKVMAYIRKWQREAPDDKIVVFTQWRLFGMILGRKLYEEDIGFLYHFGTLTMKERDKAVEDFRDKADAKVLVSGFQCGGISLNLTCANRVILGDLWWNTALEEQAFGRVKRIGQEKRTHFVRIMVRSTIDVRLHELQEQKKRECNAVYEDGSPARHKTLTLDEIASLFGELVTSNGKKRVICDYDKDHRRGNDAVVLTAADNNKNGQVNQDLSDSEGIETSEEIEDGDDNQGDFEFWRG
ncbi:hypothetical protein MFIFM68171_06792 [Madurella fahalii]|uniref:Uncharacterized protein n=1 Tax=Madurella fahalii TaxID=1157608 RepID=A0ABQ0GFN9_9PEZI